MTRPAATDPELDTRPDHDLTLANEGLPTRPRRRLVTAPVLGLTAVLIAALGFFGGVEVQKSQAGSSTAGVGPVAAAGARGAAGGRGPFAGAAGASSSAAGDMTFGTVSSKNGSSIYVKDANGTVVKVKVSSSSTVNRTAKAQAADIQPGDTVVVQGDKSKSGTVSATRITATAAGAAPGGRGFGGPPQGAPAPAAG